MFKIVLVTLKCFYKTNGGYENEKENILGEAPTTEEE